MNENVQFIGMYEIWGSGFPYIPNLLAQIEATGWDSSSNDSNQIWGGIFTDPTSMKHVPWGGSVDAHPDYLPRCPDNPLVA